MKGKSIVFMLVFLMIGAGLKAQDVSHRIQKKYQEAMQFVSGNKLDAAIATLKDCVRDEPTFVKAHQVLADVLRKKERYEEAATYYARVIELNPDLTPLTYFGLAEVELAVGKYPEAKIHFENFIERAGKQQVKTVEKAKKFILDCDFAVKAMQNPVPYEPKNMGSNINSKAQEYLPALTADERKLIFTRRNNNNEDFYRSSKENNSAQWSYSIPLRGAINTDQNEGSQSVSPDGRYLFFAGCNRADGFGRCDIYMSTRVGEEWSAAVNLGQPINTGAWESQPSISADGNTLYFVSNRPGGMGGLDLWKSELQKDGSWGVPENLGPQINTPYDEMSPYIHPDHRTLYFASNGWPGMGHKDIYISRLDDKDQWQTPENVGYPINTFAEETSFIVSADGKVAYFAAERNEGYGGLDIYQMSVPALLKPNPISYVYGKVLDKNSKEILLATAQVIDLKTNKILYENITDPTDGTFLAVMPSGGNYALNVSKQGYLFYSANFELDKNNYTELKPYEIQIDLEKIHKDAESILANVFFDTNKFNLLPISMTELNKLYEFLVQNPSLVIQIEGHTDNVGSDVLNEKLSVNRAKSVYEYLVEKGIAEKRLSYAGFGKTRPVANNDTPEGRQMNRRTAFKIMKM